MGCVTKITNAWSVKAYEGIGSLVVVLAVKCVARDHSVG